MQKKKISPYAQRKTKDEPNKKLIVWAGSIFGVIILGMIALLVFNH
ncbi:hypothetical protein SAMN04487970_101818 [Paenibacillus tianmuensis]|uniref:Uncharacterized protein n=1 Tax=Paenibacillus tianmuensis TaxID=624147 RepID=A0A1G4RQ12_9BACL|nr:hypothetical protein [Paenibacillus tianmuensis]SCW59052.1 hypothetical protein SAMN04487970_101818 [Paenibacillus tianmuensis]